MDAADLGLQEHIIEAESAIQAWCTRVNCTQERQHLEDFKIKIGKCQTRHPIDGKENRQVEDMMQGKLTKVRTSPAFVRHGKHTNDCDVFASSPTDKVHAQATSPIDADTGKDENPSAYKQDMGVIKTK